MGKIPELWKSFLPLYQKFRKSVYFAAKKYYNADKIKIEAQVYAKSFYERVGFKVCGAEFLEDGIPHVPMVVEL